MFNLFHAFLYILQVGLIVVKITETTRYSWYLILIPIYIIFIEFLLGVVISIYSNYRRNLMIKNFPKSISKGEKGKRVLY
jgi:hypothetical protein